LQQNRFQSNLLKERAIMMISYAVPLPPHGEPATWRARASVTKALA
jgi:hypothetical protein